MSLQVWLPLNGDLHNQGLLQLPSLSQNNFTQQTDGKIGKCYSGQGIYHLSNEFLGNSWSLCAWVKSASWSQNNDIILCKNITTSTSCQFYFSIKSGANLNLGINADSTTVGFNYTFATNTWYHVAATYDGSKYALYINGEQKKTGTCSNALLTGKNNLGINCRSTNANGTVNTGDGGKRLNDVRIYDHCLSPKEVEEIAKGLVLHYKLDDRFCEATTNLCQSLLAGGQTAVSNGIITTTGNNADTYWYIKPKEALVGGDKYTLSCYVTGFNNSTTSLTFGVGAQSGDNCAGYWSLKNGYNTFTFTMPAGKNGSTAYFVFDDNGGSRTQILTISKVQLEKKDHATPFTNYGATRTPTTIYDSSGYSNNGTIVGSLAAAAGSPRYEIATQFPGSACIKKPDFIFNSNIWTVSLWYLKPTNPTAYEILFCLSQGDGSDANKKICAAPNTGRIWYKGESGTGNISQLKINEWCNLIMVCDGTTVTVYQNSASIGTFSASTALTGRTDLVIGARSTIEDIATTSVYYTGKLSDFRIYATALTAAQVKELYTTSMSVDSSGNIHARELVEL